jgi:coenzyme PQQ synthesis protein D (PqqD)
VLLAGREGDIRVLSGTGADVWGLLGESRSVAEMVEALAHDYQAPAGAILEGVTSLVGDLRGEGLVEEVSGSDG